MATHFSIFGWRTPWTEEPGGLQSMGSQRGMTEPLTLSFTFFLRLLSARHVLNNVALRFGDIKFPFIVIDRKTLYLKIHI